ncbi:MAG TPA: hypothetical protein VKA00_02785, partial [Trueperaceae bacterium]|nr:hypothetical protein [Trueperaceae bacterium]
MLYAQEKINEVSRREREREVARHLAVQQARREMRMARAETRRTQVRQQAVTELRQARAALRRATAAIRQAETALRRANAVPAAGAGRRADAGGAANADGWVGHGEASGD